MTGRAWRTVFSVVLIGATLMMVGKEVWRGREGLIETYDSEYWAGRYERSQWAQGFAATELMGDADLYTYSGWALVQGEDHLRVDPTQPPMGKYLLGWSILLFGNGRWLSVLLAVACLAMVYVLSAHVLKNSLAAWLVVFLIGSDRTFLENINTTMLDLSLLFFTLVAIYSLLRGFQKEAWFGLTMIALAGFAGTKMFMLGAGFVAAVCAFVVLWSLIKKEKRYLRFFLYFPFFVLAYLLIYARYFATGHTLVDFKYYHFWVRHFARVRVSGYPWGEVWRVFLTGRWLIWWPEGVPFRVVAVENWRLLWPMGFLAVLTTGWGFLKKPAVADGVLLVWIASLLAMFSFGVPYPRYLLPVLPPLYILLVDQVGKGIKKKWRL